MKLLSLFGIVLAALPTVLAAPSPHSPSIRAAADDFKYFLRVNAPNEPWHDRHIVQLPKSKHLGLENFTVHPETPPVYFTAVPVPSELLQALRVDDSTDDMSHYPFIAALMWPASGPRIGMQIMHLPDPTNKTMGQNPGNCPAGFVCTADSWDVKQEAEGRGSRTVLKYGGFGGAWVAVKDEAPEGWSVYWDAETGGAGYVRGTKIELIVNAVKVGGD